MRLIAFYFVLIIIIMSHHQHGYPWPSLATSPYRPSLPAGPQGCISYLHRAAVCMFELIALPSLSHVNISSTETDINTRLIKAWTAINRVLVIWKSDLTDKMKRSFFQAAVMSILLYGCTTMTLTKQIKKKLDGNYTRMLRAILNKSWRQHSTKEQLYDHRLPITKTIKIRRTRHAGHCWRSRDELISDVSKVKLATIVEGDPKVPFSIATTPRCRGGRYSIPWIAPLYPWTVPYNAEC